MKEKYRIVIVRACARLEDDAFLVKLYPILSEFWAGIHFWAWKRTRHESSYEEHASVVRRVLLQGGGVSNRTLVIWYPLWMVAVFLRALVTQRTLFFCLDLDTAIPVAYASRLRSHEFIFINLDNTSKRYKWPKAIKRIIERLERYVARHAKIHLVPGKSRWELDHPNLRVVPNFPTTYSIAISNDIALARSYSPGDKLTIYFNGWLTSTRGADTLLKAMKACPYECVHVIVAGRIECTEIEELIKLPNVEYVGKLNSEEALALNFKVHLVYTFYDPAIEINRLAEPNKWGDCIATGTPFITNLEIESAKPFIDSNSCFSLNYEDWRSLANLFMSLNKDKRQWEAVKANMSRCAIRYWDNEMRQLISTELV